ncbi:MAG: hypothetical protein PHZ26_05440 [Candidatus Gracilibacteria bacterium]|nr:hypothetical protein [Candidatus Gracilibacteria bacterium]MDD2909159.1 hypothetical protein [Candidatus Gracilibacteria bacterium]
MERITSFFGLIGSFVMGFGTGRMPNCDSDTGLDYHPIPSQEELEAAGKKYGTMSEDWSPLPLTGI